MSDNREAPSSPWTKVKPHQSWEVSRKKLEKKVKHILFKQGY